MPKEITHWIIADRIRKQMEDCALKTCLADNLNMFYFGAIALDTPYYLTGSDYGRFQALASRLHGTKGENTFDPIRIMLGAYPAEIPRPVLAFICGVVTHILIDSSFHPLVYHLTGDYNNPDPDERLKAVVNHRQWESGLDIHMSDNFGIQDSGWLKRALISAEKNQAMLLDCLCMLYFVNNQTCRRQVHKALNLHSNWMSNASNRQLYVLYKLANVFSRGRLKPLLASFYPPRIDREYYKQEFAYYHIGWKEHRRESILEIEQRAISASLDLLKHWSCLPDSEEIITFLKGLRGPSLETGV